MALFYHGTSAGLFGRFSLDHALEGDGKVKFGWGIYVTESYDSAFRYARKSQKRHPGNGCFVNQFIVEDQTTFPRKTADTWGRQAFA